MGAVGEAGVRVLDRDIVQLGGVRADELHRVERRERSLLRARAEQFRRGRPRIDLNGRVAVIVDDGLATGSTARAACSVARHLGAARVVLAVPVGPAEAVTHFPEADEVVWVSAPRRFVAVGLHLPGLLADHGRGGHRAARRRRPSAGPGSSAGVCRRGR